MSGERSRELDAEGVIERTLATGSSTLMLTGLLLGLGVNRKWLLLSLGFVLGVTLVFRSWSWRQRLNVWNIADCAAQRLRPRSGQTASLFLVTYGLLRFGVEFTRQPDEQFGVIPFGWLTMGQVFSAVLVLAGLVLLLVRKQHLRFQHSGAHAGMLPTENLP